MYDFLYMGLVLLFIGVAFLVNYVRDMRTEVTLLRTDIDDLSWLMNKRMAEVVEDTKAFVQEEHQTVMSNTFIVAQRAASHEARNPGKSSSMIDMDAMRERLQLKDKETPDGQT